MDINSLIDRMTKLQDEEDADFITSEASILLYTALEGLVSDDHLQGSIRSRVLELLEAFDEVV